MIVYNSHTLTANTLEHVTVEPTEKWTADLTSATEKATETANDPEKASAMPLPPWAYRFPCYRCKVCSHTFTSLIKLEWHKFALHQNDDVSAGSTADHHDINAINRSYRCKVCHLTFTSLVKLEWHTIALHQEIVSDNEEEVESKPDPDDTSVLTPKGWMDTFHIIIIYK